MLNDYSMKENHMSKNCFKTEEAPPLKKSIINKVEKQYGKDNPKTYATLWKIYKDKKKNEDAPANSTGAAVAGTGSDTTVIKKKKKKKKDLYSPDSLGRQFKFANMAEGKNMNQLHDLIKQGKTAEEIAKIMKLDADTIKALMEDRNYRKEYDNYHAQPDQRKRNAGRLRARRLMAKLGKVSKGDKKDVHHKDNDPMNNEKGNLSVTTQKYNRTEPRLREDDAVAVQPNITPDSQFAGVDVFNVNDNDFNNCKFGKRKHARWDKYVDVDSDAGKRIYGYAKKNPSKSIIVQHNRTGHMLYLRKYVKQDGGKSGIMVKKGTKQ